mgnify:CR=1 FL=1
MNTINFKRNSFYKFSKNQFLNNILTDKSLLVLNSMPKIFKVTDVSTPNNLKNHSIIFLNKKNINYFNNYLDTNKKTIIHVFSDVKEITDYQIKSFTLVNNLKLAYNNIINNLLIHPDHFLYKDKFIKKKNSFISANSIIHKSVKIGNNCVIGQGVKINKNCIIKDNAVIKNSILEEGVIIHENSTIGTTGFGFDSKNLSSSRYEPQIGIVYISKNCSIGSSCTIDRGKIDTTFLGQSCMLDNQVHIAHNVILGNNVIIAAQCGIAGSSTIGNNVMIGGQAGISGHLKIGNNVMIGAKSGVIKNIKDNSVVAGFPAMDINKWKKMIIKLRKN